jgi:CubicO group peptidase (beta-lactamase class C family)
MAESLSATGLQALHDAMATHVERGQAPGLVTLVARGDEVHVDPIGFTDFERREPMRRETLFRIASMTKPIVAAATMMLVEDGKIALADAVDRWLPELSNPRVLRRVDGPLDDTAFADRSITVDDLLTFRFGYGHLYFDGRIDPPLPVIQRANDLRLTLGPPDPRTPHPPDEWMRLFGSLPLMAQPGERWLYNAGYLVLGVLIARVAGQPLEEFLGHRLFEPLGMRDTGFWLPLERTRGLPSHYMTADSPAQVASTPEEWSKPPVFPSGAGGLVSTVDDFLAFARLLLDGGVHEGQRLLSEETVRQMTTNHLTAEQRGTGDPILGGNGWGYGVAVVTEPSAEWPVPGRYGWSGGYGTDWFNDPSRGLVAILMTQVGESMWNGTFDEFGKLVGGIQEGTR